MDEKISSSEIISDLVRIQEERIGAYQQILRESGKIRMELKTVVERIIEEGSQCLRQLREKMSNGILSPGKIYQLWLHEKTPLALENTKKMLATCATDELITNNTYSIAASLINNETIRQLLKDQQHRIKKLHAHIREYSHAI